MMWKLNNSELGEYAVPGNPLRFSQTPIQAKSGAPAMGEHSAKILSELGLDADQLKCLSEQGVVKV